MKPAIPALALLLAVAPALRAEDSGTRGTASHSGSAAVRVSGDSGLLLFDLFLDTVAFGMQVAALESASPPPPQPVYPQRMRDDDSYWHRQQMQAREGLLLSFGLGGGSAYLSNQGPGRTGAFDLDYWLHRSEGFRVDSPDGRVGFVAELRSGTSMARPDALAVRAAPEADVTVGPTVDVDVGRAVEHDRAAVGARDGQHHHVALLHGAPVEVGIASDLAAGQHDGVHAEELLDGAFE